MFFYFKKNSIKHHAINNFYYICIKRGVLAILPKKRGCFERSPLIN